MLKRESRDLFVFVVALICLLCVRPAVGAEDTASPWSPGTVTQESISALEALQLTLAHAPFIQLQEQNSLVKEGMFVEASGQFDATLVGDFSYEYTQTEMTAQEKEGEQKRRDSLEERLGFAEADAESSQTVLDETNAALDVWESGGDFDSVTFSDPLVQAQYDLLLQSYEAAPPEQQPFFEEAMINFYDAIIVDSQNSLDTANTAITDFEDRLGRMGDIPSVTLSTDAKLGLVLNKQYRNGITFSPFMDFTESSVRYKGKGFLEDDGGMGVPDAYTTSLGFDVVLPLARGRGADATGAFEKAAQIDYQASLDALAFSASKSALESLVAYWNLVAAQKTLEIRQGSLDVNLKILEMTQALIDADELPRAEISRTEATVAQESAAVDAAKRAIIEARIRLAGAIGLEVGSGAIAPLASDTFPKTPTTKEASALNSEALVPTALDQRLDLSSARKLEDSGKVLAEAARLDLRPVTDLAVGLSYSNLGEDNNFWEGFSDSLTGRWAGPSAKIGLTVEWPIANNTQEGRLQQQKAALSSTQISTSDLERTIALGITLDTASIEQTARQVVSYEKAVASYKEAVSVEMERLQYGSVTVLDTLITQQRSMSAELALVGAQTQFSRLLAQLSFDTGRLIVQENGSGSVNETAFTVLPVQ